MKALADFEDQFKTFSGLFAPLPEDLKQLLCSNSPKELQEFLTKVQTAIKVYNDLFAKGQELYLKMHSSFPIFNRERKLVVPSITIAQLGVSNQDYPSKDINMEPTTPALDDLALSLFRVFTRSSKRASRPG
uniref:Uncharacterized protein n=1 Tax=Tanacetum cinerariifolium TaxID=118510 RepID=A0A6L2P4Y1_TANCI|nr:hypothetical protein [Tanacetum cinerariifolium]